MGFSNLCDSGICAMNNFEFWREISGLLFVVKNKQQITREIWRQNSKLFMAQIPLSRKLENPIFSYAQRAHVTPSLY